ncbi:putative acetoin reductase [Clavulina sp. PMI_390]|nr:putative acetoin reductase [Clavulina sp. PMI_390]
MPPRKLRHPKPTDPPLYGNRRRVAFVTGAARGIGKSIAIRLAKDGLDVAINDLKLSDLEDTRREVEVLGPRCFAVAGDVTDEKRVEEMIDEAVAALQYLDVMVANAGIALAKMIGETTAEDMLRVLKVNVVGVHLCYKYAARHMIKQGTGGKILAAASAIAFRGSTLLSAYGASKFAVRGYNQTAALELAKHSITCNCYAPGGVNTTMTEWNDVDPQHTAKTKLIMDNMIKQMPIKRMAEVEDVSNLVSFLVSRDSDYITGQIIPVGGGLHML